LIDRREPTTCQQELLMIISPEQSRAGRALRDLSQAELAKRAKLGLSTIVDFEKSRRQVSEDSMRAIRRALESAGVIFVEENGHGPGVRLRK
jgi:transcriptional regulator with XRE-family HTH domain